MEPLLLEGSYADASGIDQVTWTIADSTRPGWRGRYEVTAEIRGMRVSGADFTDIESDVPTAALSLNGAGEVDDCDIRVNVATTMRKTEGSQGLLSMTFYLRSETREPVIEAEMTTSRTSVSHSQDERLEEVLGALVGQLGEARWECCLTCGLSDYSPAGNGIMGMRCHREAKSRYLAARSKVEYWGVPVTEEVPEFYRCDEYEPRRPGTGYRG